MNDNMIMINKDDFEEFTFNEVQKMRHILFNICCEDYILMPRTEALREKGKDYIKMPLNDWKTYIDDVSVALGDLMTARDLIKAMKPVLQFAPHGGHWCVCQRPPGGAQRPPSLRYFDRLNNNNVMLRCPLHNSVG